MPPRPLTKTAERRIRVEERKLAREKHKQSAFLRKTLNIYKAMKKRPDWIGSVLTCTLEEFRQWAQRELACPCPYCDEDLTISKCAADHKIPIARKGLNILNNLQLICRSCNWQKGQLDNDEFAQLMDVVQQFEPEAQADIKRRLTIGGKWSWR